MAITLRTIFKKTVSGILDTPFSLKLIFYLCLALLFLGILILMIGGFVETMMAGKLSILRDDLPLYMFWALIVFFLFYWSWRKVKKTKARLKKKEINFLMKKLTEDSVKNFTGEGAITFPNGNKYAGQWKNGEPHGQGAHTWPNGAKYVGGWKDGKEHGQGAYIYANGDKYVGEFKDGQKHGKGFYTRPGGATFNVIWKDGELIGPSSKDKSSPDDMNIVNKFILDDK